MTDKELSAFGEKLYEAILMTPLPAGMVFAIATAIRRGVPWARLAPPLKLAVFKIASNCSPVDPGEGEASRTSEGPEPQTAASGDRGPSGEVEARGARPTVEIPDEGPSATAAITVGEGAEAREKPQHAGEPEDDR
jgi:hypothetical protein